MMYCTRAQQNQYILQTFWTTIIFLFFQAITDQVSYLFFVAHTSMVMMLQPAILLVETTAYLKRYPSHS
uniref:Uncharacterized protein n=1 Tax=Arundo donax TaxID=35708 RepID=A0A0A8ZGP6_ARUDO